VPKTRFYNLEPYTLVPTGEKNLNRTANRPTAEISASLEQVSKQVSE